MNPQNAILHNSEHMLTTVLLAVLAPQISQGLLPLEHTNRSLEPHRLALKTLDWDTSWGTPPLPKADLGYTVEESSTIGYYYVQAKGSEEWFGLRDLVHKHGGEVFDYLPHNGFEARIPATEVPWVRAEAQAVLAVHPGWKIDPELGTWGTLAQSHDARMEVALEFWPDQDLSAMEDAIRALDVQILETNQTARFLRALVRANHHEVISLARLGGVKWMQENAQAEQRNDKSRWVIQTYQSNNTKLWNAGIDGSNVTIGHIDGRIKESSCYFDDPTGAAVGSNHRKIKWQNSGGGQDSHGTHTAGSAAGNRTPVNGSTVGNGMAPEAFIVHQAGFPGSNSLDTWLNNAHTRGGRLHTNSWGNDWTTSYDMWCRDIDAYSHDQEDGLVVFAETNGSVAKNPENAKNVLAVAAASRANPENHGSGGRGPTADGRQKPEVFAPGCSTISASTNSCGTTSMCGTSMACPVVTGAAALLKQYFEDGYYPSGSPNAARGFTPSGALLRAMLCNGAVNMTGINGYMGNQEGYGRILLDSNVFLPGDTHRTALADVSHAQGLSHGQKKYFSFFVPQGTSELKLTMAFSDEPGAANASNPVVNDLNIRMRDSQGTIYAGGILSTSNGEATANPTAQDAKNSIEQIYLTNPPAGKYWIELEGKNIPQGPQGYAGVLTLS
ncbi:MAG: S8 family serine peptidase [Planctomycetes bacterium]|nr:S8 family serine peptidase [Planctomycetota bacterium]